MKGGNAKAQGPIRSCIGCRKRRSPHELVRIVVSGGHVVPDIYRRREGRGAHLCPRLSCLDGAIKRRSFPRALRTSVHVDRAALAARLAEAFAEADNIATRRPRQASSAVLHQEWLSAGLREFTLRIPGVMNRGPASGGHATAQTSAPDGVVGAHE